MPSRTTSRKPALPDPAHVEVSRLITAAIADADVSAIDSLPAKVRDSIAFFTEVATICDKIRDEQPAVLAPYREDLLAAIADGTDDRAEETLDALLSSHALARLIADVAAGVVGPVATRPSRTTSAAGKRKTSGAAKATRRRSTTRKTAESGSTPSTEPVEPGTDLPTDPEEPSTKPASEPVEPGADLPPDPEETTQANAAEPDAGSAEPGQGPADPEEPEPDFGPDPADPLSPPAPAGSGRRVFAQASDDDF